MLLGLLISFHRWFRRQSTLSVFDEILSDVVANSGDATAYGRDAAAGSAGVGSVGANTANIMTASQHSSNNILNPNLSGSFRDEDDAPMLSIYEPVANVTNTINATSTPANTNPIDSPPQQINANSTTDSDSVFIQTPTQGGIAVAALPHNNVVFW